MAACSRALRSSRTLPNHGSVCRKRNVAGGSGRRARLEPPQEMLRQRLDVFGPFAQRRQVDLEDVEPEKQVVAEPALRHTPRQILMRRGENADVQRLRLVGADRQNLVVFQHAQQLDLHGQRDVGQFVEEHGAAVGKDEQAGPRLGRPGEGAA